MKIKNSANIKRLLFLAVQTIVILLVGLFTKDVWYSVIVSVIGIIFNFLVSYSQPVGFIFGFIYAICNGILSFNTGVYATFIFMIVMQAPMSIYSFISWKKRKKATEIIMKKMSRKLIAIMIAMMVAVGIAMYFILAKVSTNTFAISKNEMAIVDSIFFVFSVTSCLLLAFYYKNAYIVTLLSGISGTVLWIYQMIIGNGGISIAVFYAIVSINSIIAVVRQYFLKLKSDSKNVSKIVKQNSNDDIS